MKRSFDLLISTIALIVLFPLLLIVAFAVRLDSPGSVLYLGHRIGRYGKPFMIYKFRSMYLKSDKKCNPVTIKHDQRITNLGHLLRRWKIDELPNLFNVLIGDMSLVGPRPESPEMVNHYTPEQKTVLSVRPGIACLAQIRFRSEQALLEGDEFDEITYIKHMCNKLELDLLYVRTASFWGDLMILICTTLAVINIQVDLESFFLSKVAEE